MNNLKNLKVVELNAQELVKIDGGKRIRDSFLGYIAEKVIDHIIDNFDTGGRGFNYKSYLGHMGGGRP